MVKNQWDYERGFETSKATSPKLHAAFDQVSDIRKFEIEMYWKRSGYFWALIAVTFAGYFAVLSIENLTDKHLFAGVVASIGLVFTWAWYMANRGSKYWQENWENHLDLLEDEATGPLYKTVLARPTLEGLVEGLVTGPMPISVSKVNQWTSVFVMAIWLLLIAISVYKTLVAGDAEGKFNLSFYESLSFYVILMALVVLLCTLMWKYGRTHMFDHTPVAKPRSTRLLDGYTAETLAEQRKHIQG